MTESSFEKLGVHYKMLDDSILSAWSMLMQYYLASTLNDDIIVFTVDLIKYYAGL